MIRFRPLLAPTLTVIPGLVLMIGLGVWQLERLAWKEALIANVQERTTAAPISLSEALALPPHQAEYRRVRLHGRFDHADEVYLYAARIGQSGARVLTPIATPDGKRVLVDRGFVPDPMRDPATRAAAQLPGEVEVTGLLRLPAEPAMFTPPPNTGRRLWFVRDVPAMATAHGLNLTAPIVVEADATPNPGGYPLGGQTVVDFPNNHLSYAVTWFGLALALLAVYLVYHVRQGRLSFGRM